MTVASRDFFRPEDLADLPDDNQRYEVIDGGLVVTPMAGGPHQRLVGELFAQLHDASPPALLVLPGAELHLGDDAVIPDIVVVTTRPELPAAFAAADVALVLEVTSPHQEGRDLVWKRNVYERAGIDTYVIADNQQLTVLELDENGRYVERCSGTTVELRQPFVATLISH